LSAKGKKVFIRFDGVYSYAHVWVNGKFVRDHHGGFTSWDCDITSHYPPTESFLEACDRIGIYVEEETAVCFVNQAWSIAAPSESNPDFTSRFVSQFAEMIERDRSHPCVIIWSLGNESHWGTNFEREREYVRAEDLSRPAIFSYPETVPARVDAYDLYSKHYPKFDGDLTSPDIPILNDECTHVACYNDDTLKRDPGVRDY